MATYTFTSVTNGSSKFKVNSGFWHIIEDDDTLDQIGATAMRMRGHNGQYDIDTAVDTVIVNSTTYAAGSNFDTVFDAVNPLFRKATTANGGGGSATPSADSVIESASRVFVSPTEKSAISNNTSRIKLPPSSILGVMGDSIVASGYDPTNARGYQDVGFTIWANIMSGGKFFELKENNITGVGGNTTDQMIARLGAAISLNPKVVIVMGGTNDDFVSASATTNNLNKIYTAYVANGAIVIACTILKAAFMTAPKDTVRQAINTWILSQSSAYIIPVDTASVQLNTTTDLRDGTHPTKQLAYRMGNLVAQKLNTLIVPHNIADVLCADTSFVSNLYLTGVGGTKNGNFATGSVADSWSLALNNFTTRPTVTASKTTDNGLNQQVIDVSGTYQGNNCEIDFYQNISPSNLNGTDTVEAIADFEIVSNFNNLNTIVTALILTTPQGTSGISSPVAIDQTDSPFVAGRYQMRSTPWTQGGENVTNIGTHLVLKLKDAATPTAISGTIKIHKLASRKVPANILFTGNEIETTRLINQSYTV